MSGGGRSLNDDDDVAEADRAAREDARTQAAAMHERLQNRLAHPVLDVDAGLADLDAFAQQAAEREPPSDQLVQSHAACQHVPAGLSRRKVDVMLVTQRIQHLGLNQGDVVNAIVKPRR